MHTHFLGDADVGRYAQDFADRLVLLKAGFPKVWLTIGESGEDISEVILSLLPPSISKTIQFGRIRYDRKTAEINIDAPLNWDDLKGADSVLLIDSSVHSGATMASAAKALHKNSVENILSYSLVLKRGSVFIPNYFGIIINDHDRALFRLPKYPNNRLCKKAPFGTLRKLNKDDVHLDPDHIESQVESLKKTTWGDLWYDKIVQSSHVYVYELNGKIEAFISFKIQQQSILFIDAIAVSTALQGTGIGGVLMRWAESWARSANCTEVDLWAIEERTGFYEDSDFIKVDEGLNLGNEKYMRMRRTLLYNLDLYSED